MNQLKPQIHTRTTMIQKNLQTKSKDSPSKNRWIIIYSPKRIDRMTKNTKKPLSFEQNQSRNGNLKEEKSFNLELFLWKNLWNPAARSEY